jgi:hypothetical protein
MVFSYVKTYKYIYTVFKKIVLFQPPENEKLGHWISHFSLLHYGVLIIQKWIQFYVHLKTAGSLTSSLTEGTNNRMSYGDIGLHLCWYRGDVRTPYSVDGVDTSAVLTRILNCVRICALISIDVYLYQLHYTHYILIVQKLNICTSHHRWS